MNKGTSFDTSNRSVSFDSQIYDEVVGATPWNADFHHPSLLLGQYVIRHRHDQDKQEVLAQVAELDLSDMLPIIVSCELSLCIYYARSILLRSCSLLLTHSKSFDMPQYLVTLEQQHLQSATSSSSIYDTTASAPHGHECNLVGMPVLSSLIATSEPDDIIAWIKLCFKQQSVAVMQPDRLFPLMANGNILGDQRDRIPPIRPFISTNVLRLNIALSNLELQLFPSLEGSMCIEDSSMQGLNTF